jgi:hypothetical protein
MINRLIALGTAAAMSGAFFFSAAPTAAQMVYAPVSNPAYVPMIAAFEPAGCPLYGNGAWIWSGNSWQWCPPPSVAYAPAVGEAGLYGYYGVGALPPPPTVALAPIGYAPALALYPSQVYPAYPQYGYSPYPQYGYSPYPQYGYSPYPQYGYSPYPQYGYSPYPQYGYSPYPQYGYGYPSPYGYGYPSPYGYGYPSPYGVGSITGSPIIDALLGVALLSFLGGGNFGQPYASPYGYSPYGYPGYGYSPYPSYGYSPYGYGSYPYTMGYGGYPYNMGYGGGYNVYNTYNVNRRVVIVRRRVIRDPRASTPILRAPRVTSVLAASRAPLYHPAQRFAAARHIIASPVGQRIAARHALFAPHVAAQRVAPHVAAARLQSVQHVTQQHVASPQRSLGDSRTDTFPARTVQSRDLFAPRSLPAQAVTQRQRETQLFAPRQVEPAQPRYAQSNPRFDEMQPRRITNDPSFNRAQFLPPDERTVRPASDAPRYAAPAYPETRYAQPNDEQPRYSQPAYGQRYAQPAEQAPRYGSAPRYAPAVRSEAAPAPHAASAPRAPASQQNHPDRSGGNHRPPA